MQQQPPSPPRRFTESAPGTVAALILAVLWIASMTMVDPMAYSITPYLAGLGVVILVWAVSLLCGYKTVRLRFVSWLSLAAGGYFLVRCLMSYSVVESWREAGVIIGCFVFYIAGIYAGPGKSSRWIMGTLLAALAINLVSLWFTQNGSALPWSLRPEFGVCGPTVGSHALFTYKNYAGFFLITAGLLPLCSLACRRGFRMRDVLCAALGVAAVAFSFFTGTRTVLILLPILLVFIWLLRLMVHLAENRRISILMVLMGIAIFLGIAIVLYDLCFEHTIVNTILNTDTHLRTMAWKIACQVAPGGGWTGYGACASQWEIVQQFNDWCTPNMLHNEYLQAWLDYGTTGISLMGGILLLHFTVGFRQLASENVDTERRTKATMALLYLLGASIYAICDYGWHQPALAAASAFCCGILASPYPRRPFRWREIGRNWAPGSRPSLVPVQAQGIWAKLLLVAVGAAMLWELVQTGLHTAPAWVASWQYNSMMHKTTPLPQRLALLRGTHTTYPDSKIIDYYVLHPMPPGDVIDEVEPMLRRTLEANPRQVFMSIMLADVVARDGRYEEAEHILRAAYDGDGAPSCRTNSWTFFYAYNLVRWGQQKMHQGDFPTALSMLEYGLAVSKHGGTFPNTACRTGYKPWEKGYTVGIRNTVFTSAASDARMLRSLGIEPDHSWQQPLEEGGKPALYRRYIPARR